MDEKEKTLGQRRAFHALEAIDQIKGQADYGNFQSYVQRLPATIVMNGLGQAMAGELAAARLGRGANMDSDEKAHKKLFDCVESWLFECKVFGSKGTEKEKGLMSAIVNSYQDDYVRAQAEALEYLDWLKKFSQAYLKGSTDASSTV